MWRMGKGKIPLLLLYLAVLVVWEEVHVIAGLKNVSASVLNKQVEHAETTWTDGDSDFVPDALAEEDEDSTDRDGSAVAFKPGEQKGLSQYSPSVTEGDRSRPSTSSSTAVGVGTKRESQPRRQLLASEKNSVSTAVKSGLQSELPSANLPQAPYAASPKLMAQLSGGLSSRDSSNEARRTTLANREESNGPEGEEARLRQATCKLVKWLRNRLQKRLEEVANLEEKVEVEKNILAQLNETIEGEASERQAEIRIKLKTQNELKDVRGHYHEPDEDLQKVQAENGHLVDELGRLKRTYDDLALVRKEMKDRLVTAGFSHWLETRGKDYMPATAVGVLAKSVKLLEPVSKGLEEVVELDELFSSGLGRVVPAPERWLICKMVRDLALLIPVIPLVWLVRHVHMISRRVSALHIIMNTAAIFAIEASVAFSVSVCIGREVIAEIQKWDELLVVTGVFVNVLLYMGLMVMQVAVTGFHLSKSEVFQSMMSAAMGYHFYSNMFRPVVMSQRPTVGRLTHLLYAVSFGIIGLEKKAILQVGTGFDKQLNRYLLALERWIGETAHGMREVFVDTLPCISEDEGCSTSTQSSSGDGWLAGDEDNERVATPTKSEDTNKPPAGVNVGRGYGRWAGGGRRSSGGTHGFPGLRGGGWYRTNGRVGLVPGSTRRRLTTAEHGFTEAKASQAWQ